MSHEVGDRTALVDSGRHPPRRRLVALPWLLLAIALAAGGLGSWLSWEQARLARDEVADARARLDAAHRRAAEAEGQLLAAHAAALRPGAPAGGGDVDALAASLRGAVDRAGDVEVDEAAARVTVTLHDPELFRAGDAELSRRGADVVDAVAAALGESRERSLWVHGHVDDAPLPDDAGFESAWEFSGARALAVVRRLVERGVDARRLAAVAFGASRPAGKDRARNRRIEILVDAGLPAPAAAKRAPLRTR